MKEILLALSKSIVKVRYNGDKQKGMTSIATIRSDEDSLITGGPALIDIQEKNLCFIKIENWAPYEVRLDRGSSIASVEHEWEDEIQQFDGRQINSFISEVRDTSVFKKRRYLKMS